MGFQVVQHDLLGTLGGSTSYAREINDAGQVAGYSQIASGKYRAYRWSAAAGMQNLGVLGSASSNSYATGINESGQVAGFSHVGNAAHAFRWDPSLGLQDLGTLGGANSYAKGVNAQVRVVGQADTATGAVGFVWSLEEGMQDLNGLIPDPGGWTVEAGLGINDQGVIVAMGRNVFGRVHALLLVPVLDE